MSKKNKKKSAGPEQQHQKVDRVPFIMGGEFEYDKNNIEEYQHKIDARPKDSYKKRLLFCGEATYLNTGFAVYWREVLNRLYKTGKYHIAEHGSYGAARELDKRAEGIKWDYFHNLPVNPIEEQIYGMVNGKVTGPQYNQNQFSWRLPYALAKFQPDAVFSLRDWWMDSNIINNPFRKNFKWAWMSCVDSLPQKWEWLKGYNSVDYVFAYSWFGKKVLEEQSRWPLAKAFGIKPINVLDVCQPGVDLDIFRPLNKSEVKKSFGIPKEVKFIGSVMRNQPRKLFPRLLDAFAMFKNRYPKESHNVFLLLHTSIPDVGWNIPEAVYRNGLQHFVYFSYVCRNCGHIAISKFIGSPNAPCAACKNPTMQTPTTQIGFTPQQLALIYNLMDVYVQASICEGFGVPLIESAACGTPTLATDYSAMYEKNRNGGAIPIDVQTLYTEPDERSNGTMQWRAMFDRKDLVKKLATMYRNENKRRRLGEEARECAEKYYGWDLTAKKWEYWIDQMEVLDRDKTWNAPTEIRTPTETSAPSELDNKEFIEWLYKNILGREGVDPAGMATWTNHMKQGMTRQQMEEHFRKIIEHENETKRMLKNPDRALPNHVDQVRAVIEEAEDETNN